MGGFEVSPGELYGAAVTLRGVQGELSATDRSARVGGDLGSGELEGAVASLAASMGRVALALDNAVVAAAVNTEAAGAAYEGTDRGQMGGR
jgi:hypothetical protein